ncbi:MULTISPECIES: muramoyltetrapeptide carboxypeptidase [Tatumella]|uniref:Muramoyltetrapeptide carboxypeptidase n=1 Tax=Tatumella punctata TaxID=399969 RepID=A0ABW1VSZ5_9GAMM|nr:MULTISPECIES: muramoyltetrapeptide carboxypeptidase [unclassified Tatumella]MBS0856009.1 muramoyltetrapeptide carboxypeptidase [Tatumella sp. JGM16]MBS0878068.1 muramoyltetrapeptide carboxypeptidase [Tatumella sp. JGM82]MBS0890427.1 muramoyltetrapeptide carboxypeptidase [Tatumella sp. JGM94]MBS0894684.1 muramoyltetrapeptide carboxypeptidase [Tatumella sp. JGM130]MBS0900883.1 muramoyltetrapeptide carboxypeptidase [Tatumella sp. JGM100]
MSVNPTIRLIAPSGYCINQQAAERGLDYLLTAGYRLENTGVVTRRYQRFAGTDEQRLADLNHLADCENLPDIVLAVRGGYGASRLLSQIDYSALGKRLAGQPVAICGHSDFTAIQLALLSRCGLITFSAPMLAGNFGASPPSEFTLQHFRNILRQKSYTIHWSGNKQKDFSVSGTLWGGNLAMISSLTGTPWMPQTDNGILVIEDVNEHPFRIERMLLQLWHAGILQRQQAVITGSFSGARPSEYDQDFSLDSVWQYLQELSGVPFIDGLSFGHEQQTVTLPIGATAELTSRAGQNSLTLSGYPVISSSRQ